MANGIQRAVYNSRIPKMPISPSRFLRSAGCALTFLLLINAGTVWATGWTEPEAQLAAKIAAVTGPETVAVQFNNRSAIGRTDFDEIRRGLTAELAALGVHFVATEQAAATIQVSLSESLREYLWVAEIHQGNNESAVVMVSWPGLDKQPAARETTALSIRKTFLWSQEDRILDIAVMDGSPAHMAVLDPGKITFYRWQDSRWQPEQTLVISHSHPWPRDLRGRLVLRKDHLVDAHLPGVFCRSTTSAPLGLNCYESDDPWPLGTELVSLNGFFTPARNFFTGVLAPGVGKKTTVPPFYSAAALPRGKYTLWLFAAVDGQIHLADGISDQTTGKLGWGSDIASVHSSCGSGWQVLATGNKVGNDAVRAFELPDREPAAASPPVELGDTITALWTESNGSNAIAVSQNSETGKYEAFRLNIVCGQ